MEFKGVVLGLLVGLVMVGCQQGISPEVEQRLASLEARPMANPEEHQQLWVAEFKQLDSRMATLEEPNPYLIAASVFYEAYLKHEEGDFSGEEEVFQAIKFDKELIVLWREVLMEQKPIHKFYYTLWIKAFKENP